MKGATSFRRDGDRLIRPGTASEELLQGVGGQHSRDRDQGDEEAGPGGTGLAEQVRERRNVQGREQLGDDGAEQQAIGAQAQPPDGPSGAAAGVGIGHLAEDNRGEGGTGRGQQVRHRAGRPRRAASRRRGRRRRTR
jgi:hypothetical protein